MISIISRKLLFILATSLVLLGFSKYAAAEYYLVYPPSQVIVATCGEGPCYSNCNRCSSCCTKRTCRRPACRSYYETVVGIPYYTDIQVHSPNRTYVVGTDEEASYAWIP